MHLITLINQTDPNLTFNVKHRMTEIHDHEHETFGVRTLNLLLLI